jgi:ankyrin repeat protein
MTNTPDTDQLRTSFIKAATWHGSLDEAEAMLSQHPGLASSDIHIAAILADHETVKKFLAQDKGNAMATSPPYDANPLTHLCLSKYLRLEQRPSEDFILTATLLLNAGADPNGGFWTEGKYPEYETPLYGAAGVAHHTALTRLLLERGADPNDEDAVYHSPETYNNDAMKLLVESGKLTTCSLTLMLIRKHDWHDDEGVKYLLEHGAHPNNTWGPGLSPIHQALRRGNSINIISMLMDYGADPSITFEGLTVVARAARYGRGDVLNIFTQRYSSIHLEGVDKLIAAAAMGDSVQTASIAEKEPLLKTQLLTMGGSLLARFASTDNTRGIAILLDLGIDVNIPFPEGDAYWGIPPGSLPIHVAAWLLHPASVSLLLAGGAVADQPDANGNTPLMLAVKACADSYWKGRCSDDLIKTLTTPDTPSRSSTTPPLPSPQ